MSISPKAVTFDAAGTLVDVRYEPVAMITNLLAEKGILSEPDRIAATFGEMFRERHSAYHDAVRRHGAKGRREFWRAFVQDIAGVSFSDAAWIVRESEARLFAEPSPFWVVYPDVFETLRRLKERRIRLAIISNWDDTLHSVLDLVGLSPYIEFTLASLELEWEKPDNRIFSMAVRRLGYEPFEIVHVGDDPVDDVGGARDFGLFPVLLDRAGTSDAECVTIHHLSELLRLF